MKLGFFATGVMQGVDFEELARFGSEIGYQAMDVPADQEGTRAICDRYGLQVNCTAGIYASPLNSDDAEREKQVGLIRRAIEIASGQGVYCVSTGHLRDPKFGAMDNIRLFKEAYGPLAAFAEEKGVKIVFENWPNSGKNLMITPELWDKAFEAVPSSSIGLCFDPSHLVWQGIDYLRAIHDFGDRIYHAHAKDTELLPDGMYRYGMYGPQTEKPAASSAGWWRYRLPGFGAVDWPRYIDALHGVGFDGVIAVEHEDDLWGWRKDVDLARRGLVLAQKMLSPLIA